jgi:hypothetical protein
MSRSFFAALALISLAACGGTKKQPAAGKTPGAAPQTRAPAAKPKARQTTARDTTTARNPLTNH